MILGGLMNIKKAIFLSFVVFTCYIRPSKDNLNKQDTLYLLEKVSYEISNHENPENGLIDKNLQTKLKLILLDIKDKFPELESYHAPSNYHLTKIHVGVTTYNDLTEDNPLYEQGRTGIKAFDKLNELYNAKKITFIPDNEICSHLIIEFESSINTRIVSSHYMNIPGTHCYGPTIWKEKPQDFDRTISLEVNDTVYIFYFTDKSNRIIDKITYDTEINKIVLHEKIFGSLQEVISWLFMNKELKDFRFGDFSIETKIKDRFAYEGDVRTIFWEQKEKFNHHITNYSQITLRNDRSHIEIIMDFHPLTGIIQARTKV